KLVFRQIPAPDRLIRDIVWSTSGRAYVELLGTRELVVRRPSSGDTSPEAMMQSRVKGWQSLGEQGNETSGISVSDDGRRMAWIEASEADIKIYMVGETKTFLTEVEANRVTVAPDGGWIAIARPAPVARNGTAGSKGTPIDVVWLDDAFADVMGGGRRE